MFLKFFFFFLIFFNYFNFLISQSYNNLTYEVLDIVKTIHSFPHINSNFQKESNHFNIEINNLKNNYTESVVFLPILLTCLFFISFLLFQLSLCCRVCLPCCRCINNEPLRTSINSMALWTEKVTKSRISLTRAFWVFVFLTLIACQGIIFTGIYLIKGGQQGIDSANNLYDIATDLQDSGENLDTSGNIVLDLASQSIPTCPQASYVQSYADDFNTYVSDYMDIIDPIPNDLNKMEDFLKTYGLSVATISVWSTYAAVIVSVVFIVIAYLSKNRVAVKFSIAWGLIIIHCILIFWCIFMIATVIFILFFSFLFFTLFKLLFKLLLFLLLLLLLDCIS